MSTLEKAIEIATKAHAGQVDKQGMPYILHPLRVMQAVSNTSAPFSRCKRRTIILYDRCYSS